MHEKIKEIELLFFNIFLRNQNLLHLSLIFIDIM